MGILDGKAAVVTGGAGLLGSEFAKALAKEGARVLLNDVNEQDARRVVSEIEAAGGDATVNFDPVDSWKSAGRIIEIMPRYVRSHRLPHHQRTQDRGRAHLEPQ